MDPPPPSLSGGRRLSRRAVKRTNYDESLLDSLLHDHIGGPRRRNRRNLTAAERQNETETEAMIAVSLGFPIDSLLDAEVSAGVVDLPDDGAVQNDYIVVRNHILAQWRSNVRSYLSKAEIRETVSRQYDHLISSAYDFLLEHGYINFGVPPAIRAQLPDKQDKGSVIIIGSGLAGLAAARQLLSFGFKVLILEGRDRPGGRVFTTKMGKNHNFASVDLGGSVITGIHANPLGVLSRQLGIRLHKIRDSCPLFWPDGTAVDQRMDAEVDFVFNKLLENAARLREVLGESANDISLGSAIERLQKLYGVARKIEERELLDWHLANLEYANAGSLSDLSLAHWDQDDPYEMGGDHCFLAGGNWRLIHALCEDVPILYKKTVTRIAYGEGGVEVVVVGGQIFQADMVLCTVPLGVLKSGTIKFDPELPPQKLQAIDRLGFGLLNKLAMIFPYVFWGEEVDTFGCLRKEQTKRGEFFLFYGYHTVSGGAVLIALIAGEASLNFEQSNPLTSLHHVLSILRGIYGPRGVSVPDPIQTICTRWGNDPLSRGSYSHVRVGSSGNDYNVLAENVKGRLFFAGEATNREYPATMHGAFLSGLREASCILQTWREQFVNKSISKKFLHKNLRLCSDILVDLFRSPDLEFGIYSFIFDPSTMDDLNTMGLMRITFGNFKCEDSRKHSSNEKLNGHCQLSELQGQEFHLYACVSREAARQVKLASGDDKARLHFLSKKFGLKLMGFSDTCNLSHSLIVNISCARKSHYKKLRTMHHKVHL
ncbi:lysine-specific histone demethylase 1 homolog 2 [Curcuma longa]|uniref:lysine-specific histone demethylase 1 homolog 2 n=1 Tax=Curcuma longa TaxID=136217 RepID=UPI003D9E2D63